MPFRTAGFAGLMGNGGKMHLILGTHDVPRELSKTYRMDVRSEQEVVEEIARFARGLTMANAVAVCYVSSVTAEHPTLPRLVEFCQKNSNNKDI